MILPSMIYLLAQSLSQLPPAAVTEAWWLTVAKSGIVPLLALIGVWWTLKGHDRRLRTEQLERRAKDIHRELQNVYGEFGAAALEIMNIASQLDGLFHEEYILETGQGNEMFTIEEINAKLENISESREAVWKRRNEALHQLNLAYSRLYLLEEGEDRFPEIDRFYAKARSFRHRYGDADFDDQHEAMRKGLTKFMRWAGDCIEVSYRHSLSLAAKGQWPQRKIIVQAAQ